MEVLDTGDMTEHGHCLKEVKPDIMGDRGCCCPPLPAAIAGFIAVLDGLVGEGRRLIAGLLPDRTWEWRAAVGGDEEDGAGLPLLRLHDGYWR
ncbi:hypothetical protein ACLOJK_008203 [Asimina triloba]